MMVCDDCSGNSFHIVIVNTHNHFVCANPACGKSYCQGNCDQDVTCNAGCDSCGMDDRMPGSNLCKSCAIEEAKDTCAYCGSGLFDSKGNCQKCGL